ncbi:DnaJ C-terminal domain-containing protein [Mycoplasmopsis meleagridis]|uniref:DnaJ C-terminal domain-containing protein n=1 Tax=Mycoplasmopsis meleagridis TaxID=29561 RepID=UPI00073D6E1B|nr:DnaJ C-terminal domain-containing protein [Mycoplasmopsis meleagridis]KUH47651.1 molecular chaperone DnaJ [Mycoplasmopsis meleagridis]
MSKKDYYAVLGVSKNATQKEIKEAYRKLAMQYHPDKLKDGTSDKKMQELNAAYEVLSDPQKRENYDRFGDENGTQGFNFSNFQETDFGGMFKDIFSQFTGGFTSRRNRQTGPLKGENIHVSMEISFIDAVLGKEVPYEFEKWVLCDLCNGSGAKNSSDIVTCSTCNGNGFTQKIQRSFFGEQIIQSVCQTCSGKGKIIKEKCPKCHGHVYNKVNKKVTLLIKPGTVNGDELKLDGYGEKGINGGPVGDMFIQLKVKNHEFYHRDKLNIVAEMDVSFIDILCEKNIKVPSPYGPIDLKLKNSYKDGQKIILKNKGIKRSNSVGDYIIHLNIIIPDLSGRDLKNLNQFLEDIKDNSNEQFIKKIEKIK